MTNLDIAPLYIFSSLVVSYFGYGFFKCLFVKIVCTYFIGGGYLRKNRSKVNNHEQLHCRVTRRYIFDAPRKRCAGDKVCILNFPEFTVGKIPWKATRCSEQFKLDGYIAWAQKVNVYLYGSSGSVVRASNTEFTLLFAWSFAISSKPTHRSYI